MKERKTTYEYINCPKAIFKFAIGQLVSISSTSTGEPNKEAGRVLARKVLRCTLGEYKAYHHVYKVKMLDGGMVYNNIPENNLMAI